MFESISTAPPDAILGLSEAFQRDERADKINLSVGVYKDETGRTPVLECVKAAERRLVEQETTKSYLGIDGLPAYRDAVAKLVFDALVPDERLAIVQTPGGTGAVRVAADLFGTQFAGSKLWHSQPTWANHGAIFHAAGVQTDTYRYLTADKTGLDFSGMMDDLSAGPVAGDAVLLHACCHNPTGVDPDRTQWAAVAQLISERGLLPIVDFAYQGFGRGLEADAAGLREVLKACPEALVCSSFSKNFGLYSERIGALAMVAAQPDAATAGLSQLKRIVRSNYSNPPRHGAAIVATVLADAELTRLWHDELTTMRERIATMREQFVKQMAATGVDRDFGFLLQQQGMFSFSGLNPMQVDQLRSQHSVYIVGSGRINVAGMTAENLPRLCEAIAAVLGG